MNSETKLLFVLCSSNSHWMQYKVLEEDQIYDDLIEWRFHESFYNCTLKAIAILRSTLFYCKNIKFIMKTDDYIWVNPIVFNQFITNITNSKKKIYGTLGKGHKPQISFSQMVYNIWKLFAINILLPAIQYI
jgi:hypothetical protein